jgi:CHAT domain-containing protein
MTIVSSLWKVAGRPAQQLMAEFYRQLLDGTTVPEALRAVQLVLRDRYPGPFWRGAFACHGDPRVTLR